MNMNKNISRILLFSYALLVLDACSGKNDQKTLTVSIEPQRYLLEQIVGDKYKVVSLIDRGTNPETFDPSMAKRISADRSAAYFGTGTLPFEKALKESLDGSTPYFDTSDGITFVYGTHSLRDYRHNESHDHNFDLDPHIWTSVANAKIMAQNMAESMITIDEPNASFYRENLQRLTVHLDSLEADIRQKLRNGHTSFAIWHPSLTYFAREFGLQQIAVGQESKEMSPKHLHEIISQATKDSVKVFFFQKELDSRQAENINSQLGTRLISIDLMSYDWEDQIHLIADELQK